MKKFNFRNPIIAAAILLTVSACNKAKDAGPLQADETQAPLKDMMVENGSNPDEAGFAGLDGKVANRENEGQHFLYTITNSNDSNEVIAYEIMANGGLKKASYTFSGGKGTGKGLGSQGALVLDKNHQWLYAVNAGSNSVSSFKVEAGGKLTLAHTESTDGAMPNSVAVSGDLLYVLNHGSDNIHGLKIGSGGMLAHIPGSTQPLSSKMVDAPQISFSPDGSQVIVTEKATDVIGTFKVKNNGSVNSGKFTASVGPTPFGFDFSRGKFMVVSNAAGGAAGAGSATSYIIGPNGKPSAVNGFKKNYSSAPCWTAITKFGRYAFITNTASNTVSSYYVSNWGAIYLVDASAGDTDPGPLDIVVASNNYYVYVLNGKSRSISEFKRKPFGELEKIGTLNAIPPASTGLATF
ncbi:MAG: beta-propeller fold lactonase family protein [Ferruginibacter sp.]